MELILLSSMFILISSNSFTNSTLSSIWIPYTIVKFVAFEWFVQFFYDNIFTKGKQNYGKGTQLGITFASGYLAGIFCAIISHPADTILSKLVAKGNV